MSIIIIAKNQTVDDIPIHDLGNIVVPGSGQLNLTDVFRVAGIRSSESLTDLINSDDILINDGVGDLTKEDSLIVVEFTEPINMFFGTKYRQNFDDDESSTTSTAWQNKVSKSLTSLPAGKYRLSWCAEVKVSGGTGKTVRLKVELDDSGLMNGISESSAEYVSHSGFKSGELSGNHKLDIDYKQNGGGTAYIRNARIEVWRLD